MDGISKEKRVAGSAAKIPACWFLVALQADLNDYDLVQDEFKDDETAEKYISAQIQLDSQSCFLLRSLQHRF